MSRRLSILIYGITAVFFALFFAYPIAHTVKEAFVGADGKFTIGYLVELFQNPIYVEGLINSFYMGLFTTILALVIALPLALLSNRWQFPGKSILNSLILVPLILPPFVGALGVRQFLGQAGVLNSFLIDLGLMQADAPFDWLGEGRLFGVVIMNALHLYPIAYLNISAALANLDPAMDEAAENLGCHGIRRLFRVTFPLIMPGMFAGATIIFIWSFTELGVPLIFDFSRVTSVQIFEGIKDLSGNPFPYALVVVMLVATVLFYLIGKALFGRENMASSGRASTGRVLQQASPLAATICIGAFTLVTGIAVLPHIGVVLLSLSNDWYQTILPTALTGQHYTDALGHPLTLNSIGNSLKYASLATGLDLVLGIAVAYVVVRTKLPGRQFLDAMAMLPLAVPGLVLAFGYLAMTREGQAFDFLILGENPIVILVIAYSIRRLPYVVRSAAAGFQQTSVSLEEAAQNLGCHPIKALGKVTLPLITANLIAGGLLAFSFAMLEVSDSLILAEQQQHFPITKAIYALISSLGTGPNLASALGVWAMVFLAVTIVGAGLILGRKLGALFRV
ncbi:iron ABC transporter permease [Verrucomicrobiales bacterium BCK34]|nr:iron ABC transporter permease [Verrucomicrobiales bacterium BCK34]